MCITLYSGNQGTTTSLKIEDLENNYLEPTVLNTAKGSDYGKRYRYTSSNNTKYPLLAAKEKGIGIATDTEEVKEGENNTKVVYNKVNTNGTSWSYINGVRPIIILN